MMKTIVKKGLLLIFAIGLSGALFAQSMRWTSGEEFVRKVSSIRYESIPVGVMSYKIDNNKFWTLINGAPESDKPRGYCVYADDKYSYYNNSNDAVGRYIPSQGRYYVTSGKGDDVKEEAYAVLIDGALFLNTNSEPIAKYTVEEGFDPIAVGFFLFIY
jgi:hypothetical protein